MNYYHHPENGMVPSVFYHHEGERKMVEQDIISRVYAAKEDISEADALVTMITDDLLKEIHKR